MVDRYEALGRLSQLKADGALTQAEFEAEKAKVLAEDLGARDGQLPSSQPPKSRKRRWLTAALVGAAIATVIEISRYDWVPSTAGNAPSAKAERLVRCDSSEVREALTGAVEHSAAERLVSIKLLDLSGVVERSYDDNKPERICAADVTLNTGREHTGFRIYPTSDGSNFIVETIDDPGPAPLVAAPVEPAPAADPSPAAPPTQAADSTNGAEPRELWQIENPTPAESAKLAAVYPTDEAAAEALGSWCGVAQVGPEEGSGYRYNGALCNDD